MSLAITMLISIVANPIKFAEVVQKKEGQKTFWLKIRFKSRPTNLRSKQILDPKRFLVRTNFLVQKLFYGQMSTGQMLPGQISP